MSQRKNIYFVSDVHLGVPDLASTRQREKLLISWLDMVSQDAAEIYLVGDIFDFWFEYKRAIPKGFTRLLGKLAELRDSGMPVYIFSGNHDMWMFDYFKTEFDIDIYHKPIIKEYSGKKFFIGHGDGLGPGDKAYKILKRFFRSSVCQWMFRWLHPDIGMGIAHYWSRQSRYANGKRLEQFHGDDQEWLVQYSRRALETQDIDYFVFGHRHLPLDIKLNEKSRYVNLGDWLDYYSYAKFDGEKLELLYYKP